MTTKKQATIWTVLIGILLFGGVGYFFDDYLRPPFGGELIKELKAPTEIKEVQVGEEYIHRFQDNKTGEIIKVKTTKEEYEALGLKDAGQPTHKDAEWISSSGGIPIMEMPELKDNEYYLIDKNLTITATNTPEIMIKLPDEEEKIINLKDL